MNCLPDDLLASIFCFLRRHQLCLVNFRRSALIHLKHVAVHCGASSSSSTSSSGAGQHNTLLCHSSRWPCLTVGRLYSSRPASISLQLPPAARIAAEERNEALELFVALASLPTLTSLRVDLTQVNPLPLVALKAVACALRQNTRVAHVELTLHHVCLTVDDVAMLLQITHAPRLASIKLTAQLAKPDEGTQMLVDNFITAFDSPPRHLQSIALDLRRNVTTPDGLKRLLTLAQSGIPTLYLALSYPSGDIGSDEGRTLFAPLRNALRLNDVTLRLTLRKATSTAFVHSLVFALTHYCNAIQKLSLDLLGISDGAVECLGHFVGMHGLRMLSLDLSYNGLTDACIPTVVALMQGTRVSHLSIDLTWNRLTDNGVWQFECAAPPSVQTARLRAPLCSGRVRPGHNCCLIRSEQSIRKLVVLASHPPSITHPKV